MSVIKNYLKQNRVTHTFKTCQWPYGDPHDKDFYFCGQKTYENKPYCEVHCDTAYVDERELKKAREIQKQLIAA